MCNREDAIRTDSYFVRRCGVITIVLLNLNPREESQIIAYLEVSWYQGTWSPLASSFAELRQDHRFSRLFLYP